MRISIIRIGPLRGDGVSRVVESWARILAGAGHDTTVISQAASSARPVPAIRDVESIVYESSSGGPGLGLLRARSSALDCLARCGGRSGFDLVISHHPMLATGIRRVSLRTPLLQTYHSPLVEENHLNNWKFADSLARRLLYPATRSSLWLEERRALGAISCAHTLSRYTWELLAARFPRACGRVSWRRIPGSFDERRFAPPADRPAVRQSIGVDPQAILFLTVRRLVPRNGVERLLDCASRLGPRRDAVHFLIGGSGKLRAPLERAIAERGLTSCVHLLGFIPEEQLCAYYQAADAFLLPTRDLECFGLPLVEAMACGCTPFVMPDGGPAEICAKHPEYVAAANSAEALAERVARFVAGEIPGRGEVFAEEARHLYSEDAISESVLALVEELAGR